MSYISINDTHRLPYENARSVTAKTVQSGNTTPIKFKNGLNGQEIGYTLKTNARGYLCDTDGTLYANGVYVDEDAYITVVLVNGKTATWIVKRESEIDINNGKLLGKEVLPGEEIPGKEYVEFEGVKRLVLGSANMAENKVLPYYDLAYLPRINEWNESQEVYEFSLSKLTYNIGEFAKTLVMQWTGATPSNHAPIQITLGYENYDDRYRYAQHCMVMNVSPYRMTLVDRNSGKTIGSVDPNGGTLNIGLFFIEDEETGNWVEDEDTLMFDMADASSTGDGTTVEITGAPVGGFYNVIINDRTPDTLVIIAKNLTLSAVPKPGEIKIKLVGNYATLTKDRKITLWFRNEDTGDGAGLPARFYFGSTGNCAFLYPASVKEIFVPALTVDNPTFTDSFGPFPLNNDIPHAGTHVTKNLSTSQQMNVPMNCDSLEINETASNPEVTLVFNSSQNYYTKINVTTSSGYLRLRLKNSTDGVVQHELVVAAYAVIGVRNAAGSLFLDGEQVDGDYTCDWANGVWKADFTAHFANKVDFCLMGRLTGHYYGTYSGKNDLKIKIPLASTDDGDFEIYLTDYASHTRGNANELRVYITSSDGVDYSVTSDVDIVDNIFVNGGRYVFRKSGATITRIV